MKGELDTTLNRTNPSMCVAAIMHNTLITGLGRCLHLILVEDGTSLDFSESSSDASSCTQAASTHVLNPWNIIATLMRMTLGKKSPILRNL